jgi:hypothetical protein
MPNAKETSNAQKIPNRAPQPLGFMMLEFFWRLNIGLWDFVSRRFAPPLGMEKAERSEASPR